MPKVKSLRTRGDALDELTLDIKSKCYAIYGSVWNAGEGITSDVLSRNRLYARMKDPDNLSLAELHELRVALKMDKQRMLALIGEVI